MQGFGEFIWVLTKIGPKYFVCPGVDTFRFRISGLKEVCREAGRLDKTRQDEIHIRGEFIIQNLLKLNMFAIDIFGIMSIRPSTERRPGSFEVHVPSTGVTYVEGSGQEPRSLLSLGGSYKTMASSLSQDLIHGMAHLCPPNDLAVVLGHKHILPPRLRQLPNRIATAHTPSLYASSPLKATSLFSKWRPYTSRRTAPIHILHALSSGMPLIPWTLQCGTLGLVWAFA